ncbi:hypothetical protein [Paenibacillus sacheonensis]|uniref:Uncharacterized protein n=1 Tax=Paenibacillus sacheonensis TaxID=742054 RepID=A0A7X5BXG8_9BACL|nr:hypothetical protein [Paenibacillus sacheonensis]MBM7568780.1 hypothetical protein [Paenibacillus sacheonensis]NBC68386.1 hypothetical protein [Paenibacillus sacheonensis]
MDVIERLAQQDEQALRRLMDANDYSHACEQTADSSWIPRRKAVCSSTFECLEAVIDQLADRLRTTRHKITLG